MEMNMNEYQIDILKGLIKMIENNLDQDSFGRDGVEFKTYVIDKSFWNQYPEKLKMDIVLDNSLGTIYSKILDKSIFGFSEIKMMIPSGKYEPQIVTINLFK